ncbi:MAG TPA: hypothetical protein VEO95_09535 [Chthoniobacteraceae bacterium]|nr:hypothetical protein [Chthoniobacteraceae bacterium]
MKSIHTLTLAVALAALAVPATSFAGSGKKEGKGAKKELRQFDTNGNGSIDGDEIEAVRKAFEADKTGSLKQYDTDGDGKLSDAEIAAIKVPQKKKNK